MYDRIVSRWDTCRTYVLRAAYERQTTFTRENRISLGARRLEIVRENLPVDSHSGRRADKFVAGLRIQS